VKRLHHIRFTRQQLLLEAGSLLLTAAGIWIFSRIYGSLPEEISTLRSFFTDRTDTTPKKILLIFPFLSLSSYLILSLLLFMPASWNLPVELTKENARRVLTLNQSSLCALKFLTIAIITTAMLVLSTGKYGFVWLLLLLVCIFVFVLLYYRMKMIKESVLQRMKDEGL